MESVGGVKCGNTGEKSLPDFHYAECAAGGACAGSAWLGVGSFVGIDSGAGDIHKRLELVSQLSDIAVGVGS